jgi:hypothetical protein
MHYLLSDYQAQTNSVSVKALCVLDKSEELKQLVLVLILNSYSCVFHRDFHKFF